MTEIKTFKDLYEFLQKEEKLDFNNWMENNWQGKEKQESVLRLFSSLGLIKKLNNFDICKGNFNKQTIKKIECFREIFYDGEKEIMLNDSGDASDLTGINKNNPKNILATTSKNLKNYTIGKLDIDKILTNFQKYKDFNLTLCICISCIKQYQKMKEGIKNTNKDLLDIINKEDTIIIDQKDLYQAYKLFKINYGKTLINDLLGNNKKPIIFKFHQKISMYKAIELKLKNVKEILFGHLPRSGKSYIIAGCIVLNNKIKKNKNYLFITTAPNETLIQQYQIFNNSLELSSFNIMIINGKNKNKPENNKNNIILCSKQFLQNKKIKWLNELEFDMRFIDESHNGATTEISKQILNQYGKNAFTVQITATYSKPTNTFSIKKEYQILWDMEDINLCQKIDENNLKRLNEKHGYLVGKIIKNYTFEDIQKEYSKYPKLWTITLDLNEDFIDKIKQRTIDNDYGWSTEACFLLNDDKTEFQNKVKNLDLWYQIFGKYDEYGILDNKYKGNCMEKIKRICKKHNSRFFDNPQETPLAIMTFLPQNNINEISQASKNLIEENKVIPDFDIVIINSKTTNDAKKLVIEAKEKAKVNGKKGILVLSGRQCSMGVSLNFCDIVLLLNNNKSYDMVFQMLNRGMTEAKHKTCGFVVDLNIHRLVENVIVEYASNIKPELHPIEAVKYVLNERLININSDSVMKTSEGLSKLIYDIYKVDINGALDHSLNKLKFKFIDLDKDDKKFLLNIFGNSKSGKIKEEKEEKKQIQKGIEKIKEESEIKEKEENKENKENKEEFNFMDKLRHIIPLACLLTIRDSETEFHLMLDIIKNSHYLSKIFIEQIKTWWQKEIDNKSIENFIQLYKKYVMKDKETKQIIRTVKELFKESINDRDKLSQLVDKYFIPTEIEKKSNAEVSTPYNLRNEMLDTIPLDFWKELKKVFEPCCGKGGFIIDIINRFMIGLKDKIKDEKERYKTIVEECLYFSDISETNIFICKLLIDPNDEYELNYNLGNTLELDIKEEWVIDGFDAVIGNPPYEDLKATGDNKLYLDFISYSIKNIYDNALLLFIVPTNIKNYITNQDKNRSYITNFMQIIYLSLNTSNKYFPNISTYFSYFLIKKNIVKSCKTKTAFMRKNKIENSIITINEKDELPLTLSIKDINLINKVSNLIKNQWENLDIKKALYKKNNKKQCTQRIRKSHIKNGDIKENYDGIYKYKIIDKINKGHNFPGIYYYNNYKMLDYGKPKIIMCSGGYLMPSLDKDGVYNLSDNMLYMLINDLSEYEGLTILINSQLIKYLNKVTMTDNIHGRDLVIKNIKNINLSNIKCENDIYKQLNITKDDLELIKNTIN